MSFFQQHFTKKEIKFFKLTLLIATEMSLNIKRLQTLTASSVVDCTAYLFYWGQGVCGVGFVQREVGLHVHILGICRCTQTCTSLSLTFGQKNSKLFTIKKKSPTFICECCFHSITKNNFLIQDTLTILNKQRLNEPLNKGAHCK